MADDIITSVVAGLILAAVGGLCGVLWQQLKTAKRGVDARRRADEKRERLFGDALRTLLLCKLEQYQDHMVADGGIADNNLKLRAQRVYDIYHALGGNGHGTQVNADIQSAPIQAKPNISNHQEQ